MPGTVLVLVVTRRGAFILENSGGWTLRGPLADSGWSFGYLTYDPASHAIYAAGHSAWYGPALWKSRDRGETWTLSSEGISFGDRGPKVRQIRNVTPAHGVLYAGVDPAGLFRSDDGGETWRHVGGLRQHPTCLDWAGGAGGLCLHTTQAHPTDPRQL